MGALFGITSFYIEVFGGFSWPPNFATGSRSSKFEFQKLDKLQDQFQKKIYHDNQN